MNFESFCSASDLLHGFFSRNIEDFFVLLSEGSAKLKGDGGFANPGLSTKENETAFYDAISKYAIEFFDPSGGALEVL